VVPASQRQQKLVRPLRDAQKTQQQILDAAEQEFARHGLHGARLSAIAQRAEVTTATLHYYFENKESLYKVVLQRPVAEVQAKLSLVDFDQLAPDIALANMIRLAILNEAENPQRQMLWFQEASQNQGVYFKACNIPDLHQPLLQVLKRGMTEGVFRPLNPFLTLTHILGVCLFYFTVHENWQHLTPDVDRLSPTMIEEHIQATITLILAGIKQPTDGE
jgi:TetR/AcrR family transcriptional regulator